MIDSRMVIDAVCRRWKEIPCRAGSVRMDSKGIVDQIREGEVVLVSILAALHPGIFNKLLYDVRFLPPRNLPLGSCLLPFEGLTLHQGSFHLVEGLDKR